MLGGSSGTGVGSSSTLALDASSAEAGMIPRAIARLFSYAEDASQRGWTYTFRASLLEIYNDELRDLCPKPSAAAAATPAKEPRIVHDKNGRIQVSGLEVHAVASAADVAALLESGARNRAVASTASNQRSSRSHTVFQLQVEGQNGRSGERVASTLSLVDLAGSERLDSSKAGSNPALLRETQHINSSLSSLVTCMAALVNQKAHVPFRDSKLTFLLQVGAGGKKRRDTRRERGPWAW